MICTANPPVAALTIPDPEAVRRALDHTNEEARLLRRLLRLTTRLKVHQAAADRLPASADGRQAVRCAS